MEITATSSCLLEKALETLRFTEDPPWWGPGIMVQAEAKAAQGTGDPCVSSLVAALIQFHSQASPACS